MQKQSYQIANKADSRKIAEFLSKDGQLLLPFLELICNTEQAVDELIDVAGKAAIEAVLLLSAQQLAGPKQPGKSHGDITWHGRQHGEGHDRPPRYGRLRQEIGQAELHGTGIGALTDHQRPKKVVPVNHKVQKHHGDQGRFGIGQGHVPEGPPPAGAVDEGGLLQRSRQG